jgi:hypothetical protein
VTLRRCEPLKPSRGTRIPSDVSEAVHRRDKGCVGPRVAMPGECRGALERDHVRASGGLGIKSRGTVDNLVILCAFHHRVKTLNGRYWRPRLIAYLEGEPAHTITCDDYLAHQSRHQWIGGRWVCLDCEPEAEPDTPLEGGGGGA